MKFNITFVEKSFSYLPFEGPVKLKNPDYTLYYIEYYGLNPNNIPEKPYDHFFGKWVSNSIRCLSFLDFNIILL